MSGLTVSHIRNTFCYGGLEGTCNDTFFLTRDFFFQLATSFFNSRLFFSTRDFFFQLATFFFQGATFVFFFQLATFFFFSTRDFFFLEARLFFLSNRDFFFNSHLFLNSRLFCSFFCNSRFVSFFGMVFSFRFLAVEAMLRWAPVVKYLGLSAL